MEFCYNHGSRKNELILNGENVENEIRQMYVSERVSQISAISKVRKSMVAMQRAMGKQKGIVMDGRDITTVVFPNAELKIFMTADFDVRAQRRQLELQEKNIEANIGAIMENLRKRDLLDTTRKDSPLKKAPDSVVIDTTHLTFD
jgi:cytidylate kinase